MQKGIKNFVNRQIVTLLSVTMVFSTIPAGSIMAAEVGTEDEIVVEETGVDLSEIVEESTSEIVSLSEELETEETLTEIETATEVVTETATETTEVAIEEVVEPNSEIVLNVHYKEGKAPEVTSANKRYIFPINENFGVVHYNGLPSGGDFKGEVIDDNTTRFVLPVGNHNTPKLYELIKGFDLEACSVVNSKGDSVSVSISEGRYGTCVNFTELEPGTYDVYLEMKTEEPSQYVANISVTDDSIDFAILDQYGEDIGKQHIYVPGSIVTCTNKSNKLVFKITDVLDRWMTFDDKEYDVVVKVGDKVIETQDMETWYDPWNASDYYDIEPYYVVELDKEQATDINIKVAHKQVSTGSFSFDKASSDVEKWVEMDKKVVEPDSEGNYDLTGAKSVKICAKVSGKYAVRYIYDNVNGTCMYTNADDIETGTSSDDTYVTYTCSVPAVRLVGSCLTLDCQKESSQIQIIVDNVSEQYISGTYGDGTPISFIFNQYDERPTYTMDICRGDFAYIDFEPYEAISIKSIKYDGYTGAEHDSRVERNSSFALYYLPSADYMFGTIELEVVREKHLSMLDAASGSYSVDELLASPGKTYSFKAIEGIDNKAFNAVVMDGTTKVAEFAGTSPENEYTGEYTVNSNLAGKNLTIKITTESGTKEYNLQVAASLTSIKVGGKAAGTTINQQAGATVEYPVVFNNGVNTEDIEVICDNKNVEATYCTESGKLSVTSRLDSETRSFADSAKVTFKYLGKSMDFNFKFATDAIAKAKVTAKVASVTDIAYNLSLTAPTNIEPNNSLLYYKIEVKPTEGKDKPAGYKDAFTTHIPLDGNRTINIPVYVADMSRYGNGAEAYYDIDVSLVMDDAIEDDIAPCVAGYKTSIKKVKTNAPAYATKLSLTKVESTVYQGQTAVVAKAKFDANVTKRSLKDVDCVAEGIVAYIVGDDQIEVCVDANVTPGKYTVTAYADQAQGVEPVKASYVFTVKADAFEVHSNASSYKVYKNPAKAATYKSSIEIKDGVGKVVKPKKIDWSVASSRGSKLIKINKSSGAVTIDKQYVVNKDDYFTVTAKITTYRGAELSYSYMVDIDSAADVIDTIKILRAGGDITASTQNIELLTSYLKDTKVVACDKNGRIISDVTYSVSGKSVALDSDGKIVSFGKPGATKITVKTLDGGNSSKAITLKTKYCIPEEYRLYLCDGKTERILDKKNVIEIANNASVKVKFKYAGSEYDIADGCAPLTAVALQVKNAKVDTVASPNLRLGLTAKAGELTINDKNAKISDKYSFKNVLYNNTPAYKLTTNTATIYEQQEIATNNQVVRYALKDRTVWDKVAKVEFTYNNAEYLGANSKNYAITLSSLNYNTITYNKATGVIELKVENTSNQMDMGGIIKGSYKYYLNLSDKDGVLLCDPVPVVLKVVAVPKATIKLKNAYTVKKADTAINIVAASAKDGSYILNEACNVNVKGTVNKFTDYFEIKYVEVQNGVVGKLVLKTSDTVKTIADVPADCLSGSIKYTVYDRLGKTREEYCQIKIAAK